MRLPSTATASDAAPGERSDGFSDCRWCERLPPTVRAVRSAARLDSGTASAIVHALKYSGWGLVAEGMAQRMARLTFPTDVVRERVALVPVPLAAARERERGFNQSLLLARGVGRRWSLPVWDDVLRRRVETSTQTRLTPSERAANVSGAFVANPAAVQRLRGCHLVLVDDVITTAATLNEAAAALSAGGARILSYLTFGRAPESGDRPSHIPDTD
jgi:ComF family protein